MKAEELREIGILTMKFGMWIVAKTIIESKGRVTGRITQEKIERGIRDLNEGRRLVNRSQEWQLKTGVK